MEAGWREGDTAQAEAKEQSGNGLKHKSRRIRHIWRMASSTLGEAQGRSKEWPTVPTQHPTMLESSPRNQQASTFVPANGTIKVVRA